MAFAEQNTASPIIKDDLLSGEVFGKRIADFTINQLR
jgi:NAD(P)H dehydrogenase (quinone)